MKIISKFKDYYDSAVGYGIDLECLYKREEIEKQVIYPISFVYDSYLIPNIGGERDFTYSWHAIGFCGKIYIALKKSRVIHSKYYVYAAYDGENDEYLYRSAALEECEKYVKDIKKLRAIKELIESSDSIANGKDIFFEQRVPAFAIELAPKRSLGYWYQPKHRTLTLNPRLKPMKFARVFDAFSAFQEISMFLSGVLGKEEKDTIPLTDIQKLTAAGFDKKYSFRKDKV